MMAHNNKGWVSESARHSMAKKFGKAPPYKEKKKVIIQKKREEDLELKALGQFSGTQQYHNIMGVRATDGVKYIMDNGYAWFVTDSIVSLRMKPQLKREEFVAVKLNVKDHKATATFDDGNNNILYTQKYDYTDAKRDLKLYYVDNVLMLAGEY